MTKMAEFSSFAVQKCAENEQSRGDANAGVGHIEGRPSSVPRQDYVEKIHHVTVQDAVGQIAGDARNQQRAPPTATSNR